jgi:putative oxidoreductase
MTNSTSQNWTWFGLLILRTSIAGMMLIGHGLPKVMDFSAQSAAFPDPLGLGSTVSLSLAIFGEVVCAIFLMLGLFTRLAAVPFFLTMLTAAFLVHAADPWAKKEFALLYAIPALTLIFTGAGAFSIDGRRKQHR